MNRRKMQSLINRTAKTSAAFHDANAALCEYCVEVYGCEPGDVDCDSIIDAVQDGAGGGVGMTVDEFDSAMRAAMEAP